MNSAKNIGLNFNTEALAIYNIPIMTDEHWNKLARQSNKAMKLFREILAANENGASFEEISELERELSELKSIQPDYKYISEMEELIDEAKENAKNDNDFEAIKAEILASTGDEDLAEDIAWELVYAD